MKQNENREEKTGSLRPKGHGYDFPSIFLAMLVTVVLWYGTNLLMEKVNITLSFGDGLDSETLSVLVILFFVLVLILGLLLIPVYIGRELILRWTGEKLRILRVFFVVFFSLLLVSLLLALFSALFNLGSLEITSKESDGPLEVLALIFYYLFSATLAAFWLWKRPEVLSQVKEDQKEDKSG